MPRFQLGWMPVRAVVFSMALSVSLASMPVVHGQDRPSGTPRTVTPKVKPAASEDDADGKLVRPTGEPLRVQNVPPELLKLLKDWETESGKITKLEGRHKRWEFDYTFNVMKQNAGYFYYQAPDKGRIDLEPADPAAKAAAAEAARKGKPIKDTFHTKKHWNDDQKQLSFKVQQGSVERWFCDGQIITQVDEEQKIATRMVIPPQNQREHITDGPLPFLFGMPVNKALARYHFQILSWNKDDSGKPISVTLQVNPKLSVDRSNYQMANVILNLKTYTPDAVRMIDPAGTKETSYRFDKIQVNPKGSVLGGLFGTKDPFKPDLKGLRVVDKAPTDERVEQANGQGGKGVVTPASGTRPANKSQSVEILSAPPKTDSTNSTPAVPSLIGLEWKKADEILKQLGYKVAKKRGSAANREEEVYRVERQEPDAKSKLAPGETVTIWLFDKVEE